MVIFLESGPENENSGDMRWNETSLFQGNFLVIMKVFTILTKCSPLTFLAILDNHYSLYFWRKTSRRKWMGSNMNITSIILIKCYKGAQKFTWCHYSGIQRNTCFLGLNVGIAINIIVNRTGKQSVKCVPCPLISQQRQ